MSHEAETPKFRREFTKLQLRGKHHLTLTPPELNAAFLRECEEKRRVPADLMRIILEDRYTSVVHYPKKVDVKPQGTSIDTKPNVRHQVA